LITELGKAFEQRPASEWERLLTAADVACVEIVEGPVESHYLDEGSLGRLSGFVTTCTHRSLDEVPRLKPLVRFSRSQGVAGDPCAIGEHTRQILTELGYSEVRIAELAERETVLLG
ncbi:MAG: CoA transferase, partial [Pseudonocardiales bacterium]|nr:CoA transferase [Pseudonocardiales bacterium]